ncbi:MAG: hypothetical protein NVSMB65_15800 [Chloroflexota bacterium]
MSEGDAREEYEAVVAEMTATSAATSSQMFGMPCLKIDGKAFAGLHRGAMVFKLQGESHARVLALDGAHLFDPSERGRPMRAWVVVPLEHAARWPDLTRQALASLGHNG